MFSLFSIHPIKSPRRGFFSARVRAASSLIICAVLFLAQFLLLGPISRAEIPQPTQQTSRIEIPLPTPRSHYEQFKPGDPKNPYLIALLDWGLMGTFPREDRIALMQLILGVQLGDAKRLHKYVGALLEHGLPSDPEKVQRIDALIAETVKPKAGRGSFEALQELLFGLIERGYATKFTLNLFIKSQITIAGELVELDPTLKQDDYLTQQVAAMVKKELPKRLLLFPAWNYRGYRSLLSNGDIMSMARNKPKKPKESKATPAKTASLLIPQLQY